MPDETNTNQTAPEGDVKPTPAPMTPKPAGKVLVTSAVSIDFPSLGWGVNAGEERELPDAPEAQAVILANDNIKKVN